MSSGDGEELGPLLDEQAAYYQAIAGEYYDHYLDLPGGKELTEALNAFRPAGSVPELACGRGSPGRLTAAMTSCSSASGSPTSRPHDSSPSGRWWLTV
jgi:hypothetical protein